MEIAGGEILTVWRVRHQFKSKLSYRFDRPIGCMRTRFVMQQDTLSKFSMVVGSDRGFQFRS
jgi:hypothetical protein